MDRRIRDDDSLRGLQAHRIRSRRMGWRSWLLSHDRTPDSGYRVDVGVALFLRWIQAGRWCPVIARTKLPPMSSFPDAPRSVVAAAALSRLRRLLRGRRDHAARINDEGLRLIDLAIITSVADAQAAGVGALARAIIRDALR